MMKRILLTMMVILCAVGLWAGDYNDLGVSVGLGTVKVPEKELSLSYAVDLGLTKTLEVSFWGVSDVVPKPGDNTVLGLELGKSLIGARTTGTRVSGVNINTIVSLGGFYNLQNQGAGVTLGITPILAGSPSTGKREKYLTSRVGWDFVNNKLLVAISLADYEVYLKGRAEEFF